MAHKILNLTQHAATPEQQAAGVMEPDAADKALIRETLTFDAIPTAAEINHRAVCLAALAARSGYSIAMIGGAPYLMPALEQALQDRAVLPVYAFSRREVVEEAQADGSVRKVAVFRHLGFVGMDTLEEAEHEQS